MKKPSKLFLGVVTHNFPLQASNRQNAGIFILDLAEELAKICQVEVISPGLKTRQEKIGRVRVNFFASSQVKKLGGITLWNPFDWLKFLEFIFLGERALAKFVKNSPRLNYLLAMWAFPAGYFAYRMKMKYKIPYVVWALGSDIYIYGRWPIAKILIKKILQNADLLLADGIDLCHEVEKLSGKRCIFLPSASQFNGNQNPQVRIKKDPKKLVLTFLGRLEKVKGPDILLEALTKVRNKLKNYQINFIGDGSLLGELKAIAKKFGLSKQVDFHGNISDSQKIKTILAGSDWLIIPSRSDSIPLVFSEGMKTNTPLVASDLFDLSYLIKKYKVGLIFPKESASALAKIITSLPNLGDKRKIFAKNTQKAAKLFNIEASAKTLYNLIK